MWTGVRDNPRVQRVTETVTSDARAWVTPSSSASSTTTDTAVNAVAGTVEPAVPGRRTSASSGSGSASGNATRKSA